MQVHWVVLSRNAMMNFSKKEVVCMVLMSQLGILVVNYSCNNWRRYNVTRLSLKIYVGSCDVIVWRAMSHAQKLLCRP